MNGYLLFSYLDGSAGSTLLGLVGTDLPLRAAMVGATGAPGAIAAYDADTISDARARIDAVRAAGLVPSGYLAYAGSWTPSTTTPQAATPTGFAAAAAATGPPVRPMRVFGLPVDTDAVVAVTALAVAPLDRARALAAAAVGQAGVSPVTGGDWNLLVEHVASDLVSLQAEIEALSAALVDANVAVSAASTVYSNHALFRTTNPNTPPPA